MSTEIVVPKELEDVDRAIFLVRLSDKAVSATREILYKIFAAKSWEGKYSSWGEFIESGLGKSQGWATKQIKVHEYFTLLGGIAPEELELDTEKLYMASRLAGTPEENKQKAITLNRQELRLEGNESETTSHEPEWITYCKVCELSQTNHP